jgi:hypothetical protein
VALVRGRSTRGAGGLLRRRAVFMERCGRVFENEQAEPDLRMVKLRQEIAGCKASEDLQTMRRSVPYLRIRSLWVDLAVDEEHAGACLTV